MGTECGTRTSDDCFVKTTMKWLPKWLRVGSYRRAKNGAQKEVGKKTVQARRLGRKHCECVGGGASVEWAIAKFTIGAF